MTPFTWQDIADAQADLAASIAAHEAETDPAWKAALADTVEMDRMFLAEMLATIVEQPPLPLVLPLGLPAPEPREWMQ